MIPLVIMLGCDVFDARLHDPPRAGAGGAGGASGLGGAGGTGGAPSMDAAINDSGISTGGMNGGLVDSGLLDASMEGGLSDGGMDARVAADASTDASDGATEPEAAVDQCPNDPNKLEPGECGCGGDEALAATCAALRGALRHRYSFDGTGTTVVDSVSAANGEVMNATLDDSGALTLAGGTSNDHVVLQPGIVSALTNATFETWLRWDGSAAWERVFDFGNSSGASGTSYIFLTPRATSASGHMRVAISSAGTGGETIAEAAAALEAGVMHHVAVVVDDTGDQLHLYLDGVLQDSAALTTTLTSIDDQGNWLGRSHYSSDPELTGTLYEVRIYAAALSAPQLSSSFQLGPEPAFLE